MIIEIHIASSFLDRIPDIDKNPKLDRWEVPEGADVQQVLEMLNLADALAILVLNGWQASRDQVLKDGDMLEIFGVASGG